MTQRRVVNESSEAPAEERVGHWGGAAGVLGSLLLLAAFVVVGALGLPDTSDTASLLDFTDIETARIVENTLYLGALVLWALHFVALQRVLRDANPVASLFGSVLAIFGVGVLTAGALLHVFTGVLSDLYHAASATSADQTMLVFVWQGAQGVFDTLFITGALLAPLGVLLLGAAMLGSEHYGPMIGWISIAIGTVGVVGAAVGLVDPTSGLTAASVVGIALFHLLAGWRSYRVSIASVGAPAQITRVDRAGSRSGFERHSVGAQTGAGHD